MDDFNEQNKLYADSLKNLINQEQFKKMYVNACLELKEKLTINLIIKQIIRIKRL